MSIIGLDIGTTGCKAIVFSDDGNILGQAAREYAVLAPQPGWAEQDAEAVWRLAWSALKEAVALAADDPPLALALSCQGEAVIPVDGDGRALRPAILGMDTRTGEENRRSSAKRAQSSRICREVTDCHSPSLARFGFSISLPGTTK